MLQFHGLSESSGAGLFDYVFRCFFICSLSEEWQISGRSWLPHFKAVAVKGLDTIQSGTRTFSANAFSIWPIYVLPTSCYYGTACLAWGFSADDVFMGDPFTAYMAYCPMQAHRGFLFPRERILWKALMSLGMVWVLKEPWLGSSLNRISFFWLGGRQSLLSVTALGVNFLLQVVPRITSRLRSFTSALSQTWSSMEWCTNLMMSSLGRSIPQCSLCTEALR